jgi:hypothetical protein
MSQDPNEIVVASHGNVYVAPVGTTLPTTPTAALNGPWVNLGLISEDGASMSVSPDIQTHRAWQRRQPVRRELVGQDISVSFALEQWNADSVKLAFGGGTVTGPSSGVYTYTFPDDDDALDERSLVIDWQDGASRLYRAVFTQGNVTDAVETSFQRSGMSLLPITFEVNATDAGGAPGFIYTNDSGFAAGS